MENRATLENQTYLLPREAAQYTRLSLSRLNRLRSIGGGPVFIAQSSRKYLYRKSDLDKWLGDLARTNNSGGMA
ncbi:helix-turn-helix domain-containing protein [Rhizobium leguminosarum]|uniref:helix-turn-helix domain-containing protein n=1 Tax=Rhizobium leguminosarum TaxID=384 RepID=UPI001C95B5C6|nr:helix-turn-helix domain-containing protein [Rhizobium leguminosarum]MBY5562184.1 helix-turn-helix domain-containing protein [Rhizobium leguminosarum]